MMRPSTLFLIVVTAYRPSHACPDASWRKNPATGKCYKIPKGYIGQGDCSSNCAGGALACLADQADNKFIFDWMMSEGIPGTPRKTLWIGSYWTEDTK